MQAASLSQVLLPPARPRSPSPLATRSCRRHGQLAIPNIVLNEAAAGDLSVGTVCIEINGAGVTWDADGTAFAVSETSTTDLTLTETVTRNATQISFPVTAASTNGKATITLSGLRVDALRTSGQ